MKQIQLYPTKKNICDRVQTNIIGTTKNKLFKLKKNMCTFDGLCSLNSGLDFDFLRSTTLQCQQLSPVHTSNSTMFTYFLFSFPVA